MNESTSCYCCARATSSTSSTGTAKMEIDAALNELGMLSSVTESRKQYLQERNRTRSEPSLKDFSQRKSNMYQVVRIDPKYVKGFSFSPTNFDDSMGVKDPRSTEQNIDFGTNYRSSENEFEKEARIKRLSRIRLGRMRRYRRPYEVPWRLYHSYNEMDLNLDSITCTSSNKQQQSKSNSTTPVKSSPNIVPSLPRSRSLGNLDLAKLKLTDVFDSPGTSARQDIETVSRDMRNMHVTE